MKRALMSFLVLSVLATGAVAASPWHTQAPADHPDTAVAETAGAVFATLLPWPIDCPQNYSPVICSDGQVYANSCYAEAAGATGCVPYSDF